MSHSAKYLLIGSIEPYSGKSGLIMGLAQYLQQQGTAIGYSKPIGTWSEENENTEDADIQFISQVLGLSESQVFKPLLNLNQDTIEKRLRGEDSTDYQRILTESLATDAASLVLVEGPGNLWEGSLFDLSFLELAKTIDASILLVARYHSPLVVDALLKAHQDLQSHLLGVVINDIPPDAMAETQDLVKPFLEKMGVPVLGLIPESILLRSVSVREIARQLDAKILCRGDRLDLMVESLTIGAMNVNSALEYFRQGQNKAVVTGGDRTDLQLAALETSTNCLILTGHVPPQPLIVSRAEDLEIPILSVDLDTLKTVEIVDQTFGTVRLQEAIKVECLQKLMAEHFDWSRFMQAFQF
ncbi:MAG: phosphotransacetylase family protein [Microcystaceae cyanobacterium]